MSKNLSNMVDGSEILRSPVDMVNIPLFTRGFIHPNWLFGISEPSTVLQVPALIVATTNFYRSKTGGNFKPEKNHTSPIRMKHQAILGYHFQAIIRSSKDRCINNGILGCVFRVDDYSIAPDFPAR